MATRAKLRQRMGYTNAAGSGCAGDPRLMLVAALKPPIKGPPLQQSANRCLQSALGAVTSWTSWPAARATTACITEPWPAGSGPRSGWCWGRRPRARGPRPALPPPWTSRCGRSTGALTACLLPLRQSPCRPATMQTCPAPADAVPETAVLSAMQYRWASRRAQWEAPPNSACARLFVRRSESRGRLMSVAVRRSANEVLLIGFRSASHWQVYYLGSCTLRFGSCSPAPPPP